MNIKPCIIGLGYVGLPILAELSKKFNVMGYDIDKKRINSLGLHYDFNNELKKKDLLKIKQKNLTDNYQHIKRCNFYIVCVPTPVNKNKIPDIRLLKDTCKKLGKVLKKKDIIVFESTVFPGTSEDICAPILEKSSKLKNNKDFYICYSPERINPGDKEHVVKKIKKLIAIPNSNIKKKVLNVYSQITKKIVLSSSIKETELSKVIENIQRDLNIALMNEIYLFCDKTNLNFNNVLNQASTKWNFVKYNPGLVGGHCLPVDPYYFSHVAKKNGLKTNVTIAGRITNEFMCNFVIKKIKKEINLNKSFKKSSDKIIFAGLSYKKNVSDIRNSLALKIYKSFQRKNKNIFAFDPLISSEKIKNSISSDDLKSIKNVKYIIFLVYHDIFKKIFKKINKKIKIIKFFDNNI